MIVPQTTAPVSAPTATHFHALPCGASSMVAVEELARDEAMCPDIERRDAIAESTAIECGMAPIGAARWARELAGDPTNNAIATSRRICCHLDRCGRPDPLAGGEHVSPPQHLSLQLPTTPLTSSASGVAAASRQPTA
jgi:hypothetical protein